MSRLERLAGLVATSPGPEHPAQPGQPLWLWLWRVLRARVRRSRG